jgi:hemolysin activation/secretion protein
MSLLHSISNQPRRRTTLRRGLRMAGIVLVAAAGNLDASAAGADVSPAIEEIEAPPPASFEIREYRVIGARQLPRDEVDYAVYPYMGPGRTAEEVELARAALEQRYHRAGFQTVVVEIPEQDATRGVVVLVVKEIPVGRLTVRGARFHDIEKIKRRAKSLREGNLPNFGDVEKDVISLNRSRDLRVVPEFKPGALPDTVDVELVVEDSFPLHGSAEINNRYSENTTPLRLDLSVRYENLWQAGHTIGAAMQVAPQDVDDALIFSGYYLMPVPRFDTVSLLFQAIRQNSNVSTLGGSASAGNGEIYGGRLVFELPSKPGLFHTLTLGLDYKYFEQSLSLNNALIDSAPVTYWPFIAAYSGFWMGKTYRFSLDGSANWHFRGMGSGEVEFDNRRYAANGNYFYIRGLATWEQDLWQDFRLKSTIQGQATSNALVDSEQFSLGGLTTVRGYLESQVVGDSAVAGSIEIQSPSLLRWLKSDRHELRLLAFLDGGASYINDPLPEQETQFNLWSIGFGAEIKLLGWLSGSFIVGVPQISQGTSLAGEPLFVFRLTAEL